MLLFKLNFVAMMLLQTEVSFDLRSMWASMGFRCQGRCRRARRYVGVVHRSDD
jgi:hypothetical protein